MLLRVMVLGALAASGIGEGSAQTATDYPAQARLAYAAWRCEKFAEFASLDEQTGDAGRLFVVGYRAAQLVFEARHNGVSMGASPDPWPSYGMFLWNRLGPTSEYDVGSMHEFITGFAFSEISRGLPGGMTDKNMRDAKGVAAHLYRDANCDFVGR